MPPKKGQGKGKSLAMKKKKQLERRLIQISLKLDGFVYKNRPISVFDAERYIQEISSYQNDCAEDPRSLQVIEKLIRCMTSIIADHKGTYNDYTNVTLTDHNYCPSPVYSLPDEDRSQIIENIREASRNLKENFDNEDEVTSGVSNLNIGDKFITPNTQACSQSILANVDLNTLDNEASSSRSNGANENNGQNVKPVINCNGGTNKIQKIVVEVAAKAEPVRKRRNSNKENCCSNNFLKPDDNKTKRIRNVGFKKNHSAIPVDVGKGKAKRNNRKTNNKNKDPILKIYNKCTENDLSWIENVRYVREVSNEEFHTNLNMGADFWENIDVPGIDDNDFSFT